MTTNVVVNTEINVVCFHVDNVNSKRYSIISISIDNPSLPGSSFYKASNEVENEYGKINWTYSLLDSKPTTYEEAYSLVMNLKNSNYCHWVGREVVILDHRKYSNLTDNWMPNE